MKTKTQRKYNTEKYRPKNNLYCVSVIAPKGHIVVIRREELKKYREWGFKLLKDYE